MTTVAALWAVPARRGVWKTLTLADGSEVRATLVGDEHGHYWRGIDGRAYQLVAAGDYYLPVDEDSVRAEAAARRQQTDASRAKRLPRHRALASSGTSSYTGKKRGLILLVNFKNKQFAREHDKALYRRIANEVGFADGQFVGSMSDYFKAQSDGLFELDFDVLGPYMLKNNYSYYGQNDNDGSDKHPGEMVIEAVTQAKDDVDDWSQYDWDHDGEVDQVYVVYAGFGEADTNQENTIWPHAYTLRYARWRGDGTGPVVVDDSGLKVNTYACGSELEGDGGVLAGIGTMCHEFSHCLGFPDFYDTSYSGGRGMGNWDLMDQGCYNGEGFVPAGYTSYERWMAGWKDPIVLEEQDTTVTGMKSLQEGGESYIVYNQRHRNEYFLLENRQLRDWDAALPGAGLLVLHVDYSATAWSSNTPNNEPSHQRMTWIAADNSYQTMTYMGEKYYTWEGMATDPYPSATSNAFNSDSKPAAKFYNLNTDGTYYMSSSVEDIEQSDDGTVSFSFVADYKGSKEAAEPQVTPTPDGALFYESFDRCNNSGGNDNQWSGHVASGQLSTDITDNEGWTSDKAYAAAQCARFGTGLISGSATTPAFTLQGEAKLFFKAGAWNADADGTTLSLTVTDGGTVKPASVTMKKGEFTSFSATITGTGQPMQVVFATSTGRFFLDEVIVKQAAVNVVKAPISEQGDAAAPPRIYTPTGCYVGTDLRALGHGLYVVGGKKIMK